MRTLTPEHITLNSGLPAYLTVTSRRSASNHVVRSGIALPAKDQRAGSVPGFATSEQARRYTSSPRILIRGPFRRAENVRILFRLLVPMNMDSGSSPE